MSVVMLFTQIITVLLIISFLAVDNAWYQWIQLPWKKEFMNKYSDRDLKPITLVFKVRAHQRTIRKSSRRLSYLLIIAARKHWLTLNIGISPLQAVQDQSLESYPKENLK